MLVSSLLFGTAGTYEISNIRVNFDNNQPATYNFSNSSIGNLGNGLLKSRVFNLLTLGYLHTFVHEMGHALAHLITSGGFANVEIHTSDLSGCTRYSSIATPINDSIVSLAGPLSDVVFSVTLIFAAFALSSYITVPVAAGLAIGSAIWIFGEGFYAFNSLMNNDNGDFGRIARNGNFHLLTATAVVVSVLALGVLATAAIL